MAERDGRPTRARSGLLALIGPGLLVAATGVGAGDLNTAGFAGVLYGTALAWAILLGALFKYVLTEGLARWQCATETTVLEGTRRHLGRWALVLLLVYMLPWSFSVGAALISASGVTLHALVPVLDDPEHGRIAFGIAQSLVAMAIAWFGGFRTFERIMTVGIGIMFLTVCTTALLLRPDWGAIAGEILRPRIPTGGEGGRGAAWTVSLIGGVGGTLTIICYAYWMREQGWGGIERIRTVRTDLAVGYGATALFGIAMLVIARGTELETSSGLVLALADQLREPLGEVGRLVFLLGAWAAVFSSLLGVWQSVPFVFADVFSLLGGTADGAEPRLDRLVDTSRPPYRIALLGLGLVPMLGLVLDFAFVQMWYGIVGALFLPLLALVLLAIGRRPTVDPRGRTGIPGTIALVVTLLFFVVLGWINLRGN